MNNELIKKFESLGNLVTGDQAQDNVHNFYKRYFNLPGNPFPPSGIADVTEGNPPLRFEIAEKIFNFIETSYNDRQLHALIIAGEYGTGKTHTLRFIEQVVNTFMNKGDQSARAIYVERPRIEINELNRTILRRLGLDTVRKYIWFAIRDLIISDIENDSEEFKVLRNKLTLPVQKSGTLSEAQRFWMEEEAPVPPKFLEVFNPESLSDYRIFLKNLEKKGWNREDVRYYLVECLAGVIGNEDSIDLAPIFIALLLAKDEKSFSSWESLVSVSNPKATLNLRAPNFLQFLLRIMRCNGVAYVYLLLDEFEEVPEGHLLSSRQRQEYLYTLREVFDKIQEGLSVIISITPGGLEALSRVAVPLVDRAHRIDLPPLELDDAVKLVQFYFDNERQGSSIKAKEGDISPLSEELISYTLNNLPANIQRTPRNLIQFLHRLFDYAQRNQVTDIDEELIQKLLIDFSSAKPTEALPPRRRK